jgi:hypothetical protein
VGSAFLGFNNRPTPSSSSAEDIAQALPALVCDCHYETPSNCAAN